MKTNKRSGVLSSSKLKGTLSISKSSLGTISVTIEDTTSGISFARIELSPAQFAEAITGLHDCPGELEIRGLQYVGKKKEVEHSHLHIKTFVLNRLGISGYNSEQLENYLEENAQREGWLLNSSLRSRSSVINDDDGVTLHFSYTRYVRT